MNESVQIYESIGQPRPDGTYFQRLGRRALWWSVYALALALLIVLLPILVLATGIADIFMRTQGAFTRALFFFIAYFVLENCGIFMCLIFWLTGRLQARANPGPYYRRHLDVQAWIVRSIINISMFLFRARLEVEGDEDFARKPFILFVRHSSVADTLLPLYIVHRRGANLRVVIKRELLRDPFIDSVMGVLPGYFVRRGLEDNTYELERVGNLMKNLGPKEGIFIYPEGTRFTKKKQKRVLQKIKDSGDAAAYERATEFRRVLPPRIGGSLALLEQNEGADAIFCTHVGLERSTNFREFHRGGLVGITVRMKLWRVPFEEIPTTKEARIDWLHEQWRLVDDFIVSHLENDDKARQVA